MARPPQYPINPGDRFARLTVVSEVNRVRGNRAYHCRCDCGKDVIAIGARLRYGNTRSCGCLQREALIARNKANPPIKHGLSRHPLYHTWLSAHQRCIRPDALLFKHYGARGISVCARWSGPEGLQHFISDMGDKPSPKHSLDRIDNDGPYSPENCRWATAAERRANQRMKLLLSEAERSYLVDLLVSANTREAETILTRLK